MKMNGRGIITSIQTNLWFSIENVITPLFTVGKRASGASWCSEIEIVLYRIERVSGVVCV